ncbi:MAG TPA: 4-alpha-glucanotransferase [Mycobacteriales bacterium]|nr:4-alpha-glucanotransferase [Mycobacteriales bacterium]
MPADLAERAAAAGVATTYLDWARQRVTVDPAAVAATLELVGAPAPRALVSTGPSPVAGTVALESGETVTVAAGDPLPLGVHRFGDVPLVVAPPALPWSGGRLWGWQIQLYQLRSARSWGIGDYEDLRTIARATAARGAGVLLVNPMHAVTPVLPIQPSPYFPSSRRFADQVAVAVDALPEYRSAPESVRIAVDALRPVDGELIDRDAVWTAKRAAFALLVPPGPPVTDVDWSGPDGFAVFCALAEEHGAAWDRWPAALQRPGPDALAAADPDRVRLHRWIQQRAVEQLDAAQQAARDGGMAVGIVHDLAVGVDPLGADAWLLPGILAAGATVGAPPDSFNQRGQDWGFPPFRPGRLAETAYEPFRQVVRAALTHGGGLRVDHVMGLFRLWWVPAGRGAAGGTYVAYDADAMLAVVVLEATRAGALVVGEDLGTVEPGIRVALDRAGVLGSAVLWFSREEDEITPLPPERYRERAVASVSTHDLPTAYGLLADEQVRVRASLGQLDRPEDEELRRVSEEKERLLTMMRAAGLAAPGSSPEELVLDMYRLLVRTPCRVVLAMPADAVGDLRQPNLPGTQDEYPNWRLPLADPTGKPVSLETFLAAPGTTTLTTLLTNALSGTE